MHQSCFDLLLDAGYIEIWYWLFWCDVVLHILCLFDIFHTLSNAWHLHIVNDEMKDIIYQLDLATSSISLVFRVWQSRYCRIVWLIKKGHFCTYVEDEISRLLSASLACVTFRVSNASCINSPLKANDGRLWQILIVYYHWTTTVTCACQLLLLSIRG